MDNFNKILSFVLGLVVVIVFIAVLTGRLNLRNRLSRVSSVSPTVSPKNLSPTPKKAVTPAGYSNYQTKTPSTIPATGLPTQLLALIGFGLLSGTYLRNIGNKK